MRVADFDYNLPEELIAQTPLKDRTTSRLLVLNKETGNIEHKHFYDIIDYLDENDVLVINDTKVLPSRIYGNKVDTNAFIELLLLKETDKDTWVTLTKPARRVKIGTEISFSNGLLIAKCIGEGEDGEHKVTYNVPFSENVVNVADHYKAFAFKSLVNAIPTGTLCNWRTNAWAANDFVKDIQSRI